MSMEAQQLWTPYNERVRARAQKAASGDSPSCPVVSTCKLKKRITSFEKTIANGKKLVEYRVQLTARAIRKAIEGN